MGNNRVKSKTTTKSELLLASKNSVTGDILYTWRLTFPRIILAEVNTHRMASRNTSSSRAIPSKTMRKAVLDDPFIPISLGRNQKGMQGGAEITGLKRQAVLLALRLGRYPAVCLSWLLEALGAHKQVANRCLEPYSWCTQILSATAVQNLFLLRNHPDAEPHFRELAAQMQEQSEEAVSEFARMEYTGQKKDFNLQILNPGEWHLPMLKPSENYSPDMGKRISAARCARTSYTLIESGKESTMQADLALCDRLFGGDPKHLSPCEHQAQAMEQGEYFANFRGFSQFRREISGEAGGDLVGDSDKPLDISEGWGIDGGVYLNATERELIKKLVAGYHTGPVGAAALRTLRGE